MKHILVVGLFIFGSTALQAQLKTINNRSAERIIPKQRAILVRSKVVDLKFQLKQFSDSVSITKQEIDNLTASMKNDLDKMSDMGESESLRLQMAMDRLSKMMNTLSNILKKISDTSQSITQNMK